MSSPPPRPAGTLPRVAIVGRPNVGKSTLLNRIAGRRVAIVEQRPGVTRDRLELECEWAGRRFVAVDTGGVVARGDALDAKVREQALAALARADLVLVVADATVGATGDDALVADLVRRRSGGRHLLVANKVDSTAQEPAAWALARLGLGDPFPVSALHGRAIGDLLDEVVARLDDIGEPQGGPDPAATHTVVRRRDASAAGAELGARSDEAEATPAVAIVGRPNVGKSTLFNRLVGEERSIVHDLPGTTRDAVDTVVRTPVGTVRLVDTAGMRRRSRIPEPTEYYSLVRALAAVDRADVALLVLDATEGVTHQDQRLAERVDASGSPVVVVCNKWDLLGSEERAAVRAEVGDRLGFLSYAPVLGVSARTGRGVERIFPALRAAIDAYHRRIPTARLNAAVQEAQAAHPAPGARILYAVQGATDPPTVTLFASGRLPPTYLRYLERALRERFDVGASPLKLRVRLRGRA
jgi:GTP-binding protein